MSRRNFLWKNKKVKFEQFDIIGKFLVKHISQRPLPSYTELSGVFNTLPTKEGNKAGLKSNIAKITITKTHKLKNQPTTTHNIRTTSTKNSNKGITIMQTNHSLGNDHSVQLVGRKREREEVVEKEADDEQITPKSKIMKVVKDASSGASMSSSGITEKAEDSNSSAEKLETRIIQGPLVLSPQLASAALDPYLSNSLEELLQSFGEILQSLVQNYRHSTIRILLYYHEILKIYLEHLYLPSHYNYDWYQHLVEILFGGLPNNGIFIINHLQNIFQKHQVYPLYFCLQYCVNHLKLFDMVGGNELRLKFLDKVESSVQNPDQFLAFKEKLQDLEENESQKPFEQQLELLNSIRQSLPASDHAELYFLYRIRFAPTISLYQEYILSYGKAILFLHPPAASKFKEYDEVMAIITLPAKAAPENIVSPSPDEKPKPKRVQFDAVKRVTEEESSIQKWCRAHIENFSEYGFKSVCAIIAQLTQQCSLAMAPGFSSDNAKVFTFAKEFDLLGSELLKYFAIKDQKELFKELANSIPHFSPIVAMVRDVKLYSSEKRTMAIRNGNSSNSVATVASNGSKSSEIRFDQPLLNVVFTKVLRAMNMRSQGTPYRQALDALFTQTEKVTEELVRQHAVTFKCEHATLYELVKSTVKILAAEKYRSSQAMKQDSQILPSLAIATPVTQATTSSTRQALRQPPIIINLTGDDNDNDNDYDSLVANSVKSENQPAVPLANGIHQDAAIFLKENGKTIQETEVALVAAVHMEAAPVSQLPEADQISLPRDESVQVPTESSALDEGKVRFPLETSAVTRVADEGKVQISMETSTVSQLPATDPIPRSSEEVETSQAPQQPETAQEPLSSEGKSHSKIHQPSDVPAAAAPEPQQIIVRMIDSITRNERKLRIRDDARTGRLLKSYCNHVGADVSTLKFEHNGALITAPEFQIRINERGISNNDIIYVTPNNLV